MDALILCFLFHVFLNRRYYVSMLRALLHGKADGRSSTTTPVGMGCENLRSAIKKDVPGQQEHPFRIIYGSCPPQSPHPPCSEKRLSEPDALYSPAHSPAQKDRQG